MVIYLVYQNYGSGTKDSPTRRSWFRESLRNSETAHSGQLSLFMSVDGLCNNFHTPSSMHWLELYSAFFLKLIFQEDHNMNYIIAISMYRVMSIIIINQV